MEHAKYIYLTSNEEVLMDENYRYKICKPMYKLLTKKGKLITTFENLNEFSKQLHITPKVLIKVLIKVLHCASGHNEQVGYFVGQFNAYQINMHLCQFIQSYWLCYLCSTPEVIMTTSKNNKRLKHKCKACGGKRYIDNNNDDKCYNVLLHSHMKVISTNI